MVFNFEIFDLLSPEITFHYKGKLRHSSNSSGILSILSIIITMIVSIIFALELKRKNPSAFYYNRYIENIIPTPYNSSGLFHLINVSDTHFPYESNRLFSIIGVENHLNIFDFNNIESFDHFIYDYCDTIDIQGIEDTILEGVEQLDKLFCIKKFYNKTSQKVYNLNNKEFPYPEIMYGTSNPSVSIYGVVIQKCKNSSIINKNNCYSNETINDALKFLTGYSIDFLDHNIIIENYDNPNSDIYYSNKNLYSFGSGYSVHNLNFLPTMLKTNAGYFLDHEVSLNSYKFSYNEKYTYLFSEDESLNKDIYGVCYFWIQNQEETFARSYKKIQDILGSITGVTRFIFLFAKTINFLIHNHTYINDMNYDMKNHCKLLINKRTSIPNSPVHNNIQVNTKNMIQNNNNIQISNKFLSNPLKLNNTDKSSIQINYDLNGTGRIYEQLKKIGKKKNCSLSFWEICKVYVFQRNNDFLNKLISLREYAISEEIMLKYYFIINFIKNPLFEQNNILKDLELFKEDNLIVDGSINNENGGKN